MLYRLSSINLSIPHMWSWITLLSTDWTMLIHCCCARIELSKALYICLSAARHCIHRISFMRFVFQPRNGIVGNPSELNPLAWKVLQVNIIWVLYHRMRCEFNAVARLAKINKTNALTVGEHQACYGSVAFWHFNGDFDWTYVSLFKLCRASNFP